jgi:hypothetical protein
VTPLSAERLAERGAALARLLDAGVSVDRLCALDRAVRHGRRTDWPGRRGPEEPRQGIPELDAAASWWAGEGER